MVKAYFSITLLSLFLFFPSLFSRPFFSFLLFYIFFRSIPFFLSLFLILFSCIFCLQFFSCFFLYFSHYFTPYKLSVSLLYSFLFSISPFPMSFSSFLSFPSFLLSSQHDFCHSAYNLSLSISFSSTFVSHHFLDFFNASRSLKHTHTK